MGKLVGLLLVLAGCPNNVAYNAHTGPDGVIKGAKPLVLDNNEGHARGIVTYPGGDRIDWAQLTLPEKQHGKLELEMSYVTPRPGLRLSFDLFDQTYRPIKTPVAGTGRRKSASIADIRGAVFIRIYAPRRGDAGRYDLKASFTPIDDLPAIPSNIPDPPTLPALPPIVGPACATFNASDPTCASVCPAFGEPPGWPACNKVCRDQDPDTKPACLKTRPCPNPPDPKFAMCTKSHWKPCPDPSNPDPTNPNCPATPVYKTLKGRIIQNTLANGHTLVTVNVGPNSHVDTSWRARVVTEKGRAVSGGQATVVSVTKNGEVHLQLDLKVDQLQSPNDWVELTPSNQ